jgi:hypothetical protein
MGEKIEASRAVPDEGAQKEKETAMQKWCGE